MNFYFLKKYRSYVCYALNAFFFAQKQSNYNQLRDSIITAIKKTIHCFEKEISENYCIFYNKLNNMDD